MAPDPNIVRRMVREGRAADLHRMLLAISPYSKAESKADVPYDYVNDLYLFTLVVQHVEFVSQYGPDVSEAWTGKYIASSHASDFERWLFKGMPGLVWADVEAYLRDHPLA